MKSKIALLELSLIILAIIGLLFKIMHYPFARIMLITSSCFLAMLFFQSWCTTSFNFQSKKICSFNQFFIACSIATIGLIRVQRGPETICTSYLGGMYPLWL